MWNFIKNFFGQEDSTDGAVELKVIYTNQADVLYKYGGASAGFWYESKADLQAIGEYHPEVGDDDRVVLIHQRLAQLCTPQEIQAIVAHEEGHIALGHLERPEYQVGQLTDMPAWELEADTYAIRKVGKHAFMGSLKRMADLTLDIQIQMLLDTRQIDDSNVAVARHNVKAYIDGILAPRFAAAEAL